MTRLSTDLRATRLLLAVMFGLLALGPFLHAHLGFSKITGFHVAGYNALAAPNAMHSEHSLAQSPELFDAESPAVGVSASLLRIAFDVPCPDGMTLQSIIAVIAAPAVLCSLPRAFQTRHHRPARPRPGLPPPVLAPPIDLC